MGVLTLLGALGVVVLGAVLAGLLVVAAFDGGADFGIDGPPPACPESELALLQAAHGGDLERVSQLLQEGDPPDAQDGDGRTALYCAARGRQAEVTARLLAAGANPDIANAAGDTPLLWASQEADLVTVDALLAGGADVDRATDAGHTPLLRAVYTGDLEVVRRLLAAGADPNIGGGADSTTARLLVEQVSAGIPPGEASPSESLAPGIAPTATGTAADNITPLHVATAFGRADLVGELLLSGADPDATTLGGFTPLHVAAMVGSDEAAGFLLYGGADPLPATGQTEPAVLARASGHTDLAEMIETAAQPGD